MAMSPLTKKQKVGMSKKIGSAAAGVMRKVAKKRPAGSNKSKTLRKVGHYISDAGPRTAAQLKKMTPAQIKKDRARRTKIKAMDLTPAEKKQTIARLSAKKRAKVNR